jgi:thiamine-phosphate pyrophosphorylase
VRLPDPPLLLVTDRRQASGPLVDIVDAAFAAGCRWASVREKDLPVRDQIALAAAMLPLARQSGSRLTMHGDAEAAAAAGVDGVHLPAGADAVAARARLGPAALVGISVHTIAEARRLDGRILDYCIAGPVFASASKPGYGPALGPSGVTLIARATALPVIAIGGVTESNVGLLAAAGVSGIAVMGGLMRAGDTGAEVRALVDALSAARDRKNRREWRNGVL